jgi:hypothetical protein
MTVLQPKPAQAVNAVVDLPRGFAARLFAQWPATSFGFPGTWARLLRIASS